MSARRKQRKRGDRIAIVGAAPGDPGLLALRGALVARTKAPLEGKCVVVTRPLDSAAKLAAQLCEAGAEVRHVPAIRRRPPRSFAALDRAIARLGAGAYLGVLFTSPATVESFFGRLAHAGHDARRLAGTIVAAVGVGTAAALAAQGIIAEIVGSQGGVALARRLTRSFGLRLVGARFLLPRAANGREELAAALRGAGAVVDVVDAYETVASTSRELAPLIEPLGRGAIDAIVFASPSAVDAVATSSRGSARRALRGVALVAIGPTTADALVARGLPVAAVASRPTDEALVSATKRALRRRGGGKDRSTIPLARVQRRRK